MLWSGLVTKEEKDEFTTSIHNLNQKIHKDERVDNSLLPFGDGLERFEHYHIIYTKNDIVILIIFHLGGCVLR
jgi:hypothetical protein